MVNISVCIITLWRETLYKTLHTIFSQKINSNYEVVIILQWSIDEKRIISMNVNNVPFHIFNFNHGLWFGFYRNKAIEFASWDILAWIDDDEWTIDDTWLDKITQPIRTKWYQVVTSGCIIELGQWYMTDCISLLWWPGGWALGFEKMWDVTNNITNHLCTGNFAILKSLIQNICFSLDAIYGGEDNGLSKSLTNRKIPILYKQSCTVYHEPRTFFHALHWWRMRVINNKRALKLDLYEEHPNKKRISFLKNLFIMDRYIWGKIFCCVIILYYYLFIS